ncbi:AAA family ATPase [Alteromonas sp. ZYF713]|nr:AAA family ATPase [Alteromonas sp. ZYF713]
MKLHLTGCILLMMLISLVSDPVAAQNTPLRGPKDATNQYSGVVFGPIDSNDTLWRVASRYRQNPNLSIYQVMVAIYELNPDAFEQNNLNLMVDGANLKLPSERYIARIDKEKARQKAEADDAAFARMANQPGDSLNNLKPPVPLVNQDDLTQTKTQLEQQLNQIDASQARQFEELRDQFAASIDSVQMLLDDNRKLYDRIEKINEDLSALRGRVDDEVEVKVDEQLALQRELRELILSEKAAKEAEQSNSFVEALTSPMALIAGTGLLTFSAIAGLIVWLMKRKSKPEEEITLPPKESAPEPEEGIADLSTALESELGGDELSDEELFNDDDLLDDVLSTELEESLNDDDSFADLNDDMLVPDESKEESFEEGDSALDQDDLDSLFDDEFSNQESDEAIDLSDDDDLLDNFDEDEGNDDLADFSEEALDEEPEEPEQTSDEELAALLENPEQVYQSETAPEAGTDTEDDGGDIADDDDIDAILAAQQGAPAAAESSETDEEEAPEISIDELLEENKLSEEEKANLPVDDGPVGDEMLEKLDDEITQQSQALDRLTDSIISEMDQIEMMGDLAGDLDDEDDEEGDLLDDSIASESKDSDESKLQSIDEITDDLDEIDFDNIENADAFDDPLSDELLAELEAELPEEDAPDETTAESGEDEFDEAQFEQEVSDDLTDELLKELEGDPEGDPENDEGREDSSLDADADDFDESDLEDDLTRELLSELEQSEDNDDVVEVEADEAPLTPNEEQTPDIGEALAEDSDDIDDPLTDDLLAELSVDEEDEGNDAGDEDEQTQALTEELDELDNVEPAYSPDEDVMVEDTTEETSDELSGEPEPELPDTDTEEPEPSEESDNSDDLSDDALEQALAEFDRQMMDDIPSLSGEAESAEPEQSDDIDDDILDQALEDFESEIDSFELEQEQDGVLPGESDSQQERSSRPGDFDELEDVPGLDEWLNDSDSGEEAAILDELDNSEFDELLGAIDNEDEAKPEEEIEELALDNPDLDLNALFSEQPESTQQESSDAEPVPEEPATPEEEYVDVETLMAEADDVPEAEDERDLDLDVSLSEFSGVSDDDDVFDIDKDAGQNANLDLARVYIEMDDPEAAKELLEEVMNKGSEAQQEEAKKLIETL